MNFNKFIFSVFNPAHYHFKAQLFVFTLDFCFELQYSNRPTHPKTKIPVRLDAGVALEPQLLHPDVGKNITLCPSLISLSPGCRPGPAEAADHNQRLFMPSKDSTLLSNQVSLKPHFFV